MALVNEDGQPKQLPTNLQATHDVAARMRDRPLTRPLLGTVIIVSPERVEDVLGKADTDTDGEE